MSRKAVGYLDRLSAAVSHAVGVKEILEVLWLVARQPVAHLYRFLELLGPVLEHVPEVFPSVLAPG